MSLIAQVAAAVEILSANEQKFLLYVVTIALSILGLVMAKVTALLIELRDFSRDVKTMLYGDPAQRNSVGMVGHVEEFMVAASHQERINAQTINAMNVVDSRVTALERKP
jgi:cytochrome c biogenesis protein CcdA